MSSWIRLGARARVAVLFASLLVGCGDGTSATGTAATTDASTSTTTTTSTGTSGTASTGTSMGTGGSTGDAGAVDRGPTSVPFATGSDANGLWWDEATSTLYIADDGANRVLEWTDAKGLALVGNLPTAASDPGLGQIVKTSDGKLVVTRFGYGTTGDIAFLNPDKTSGTVPSLDVTRRRIGLTVASDGTLYDGYFVKTATSQIGAVARLDLAGTETDVITALTKPVGVLASGTELVVDDQATNTVVTAPIATPTKVTTLVAMITTPDLLCNGPNGTFFTGGTGGDVRQITATGSYTTFSGGYVQVRGVAYDAANKRLFFAEHDPNGVKNALHIIPVN